MLDLPHFHEASVLIDSIEMANGIIPPHQLETLTPIGIKDWLIFSHPVLSITLDSIIYKLREHQK